MPDEDPPPTIDLTNSGALPTLNITEVPDGGEGRVSEIPTHSAAWAGVVRPFTFFIFRLLAAVILLPFLLIFVADSESRDIAYDWAKTILAPVVGFASAAIGYYYGTRQGGVTADSSESVGAQPGDDE